MNELEQLEKAMAYAKKAHQGQVDKGGNPYEEHLSAVASGCRTVTGKTVAWLHDIIEDTDVDVDDLRAEGFSEDIIEAVSLLTKVYDKNFDYYDYLCNICENPLACEVKKADLINNMDLSRLKSVTSKDMEYHNKYEVSYRFLNGDLENGFRFPENWSRSGK